MGPLSRGTSRGKGPRWVLTPVSGQSLWQQVEGQLKGGWGGGQQMWVLDPKYFPITSVPSLSTVLGDDFQAIL